MALPALLGPLLARAGRALVRTAARAAFAVLVGAITSRTAAARALEDNLRAAAERYSVGDLRGARDHWLEALKEKPDHFGALYRVSRAESEMGEDAVGEDQRRLIADAVGHARGAVQASPDSAQGHLALAVALGRQALHEGAKTRLALSREIKSEVDRALAIDPALGRAYHVRAIWNRKLSSLNFMERTAANAVLGGVPKGASMENAVSDLRKAIQLEPDYVNHHLELGRTYMQLKRKPEAIVELERALALPTVGARDVVYRSEARELLYKLQKH